MLAGLRLQRTTTLRSCSSSIVRYLARPLTTVRGSGGLIHADKQLIQEVTVFYIGHLWGTIIQRWGLFCMQTVHLWPSLSLVAAILYTYTNHTFMWRLADLSITCTHTHTHMHTFISYIDLLQIQCVSIRVLQDYIEIYGSIFITERILNSNAQVCNKHPQHCNRYSTVPPTFSTERTRPTLTSSLE